MSNTATAPPLRAIQFGTVRFNDKPEARYKCSPRWERFTTRLDGAKLNMRLLSDSSESGTGSSNSLRSTTQSISFRTSLRIVRNPRVCARFSIRTDPENGSLRSYSAEFKRKLSVRDFATSIRKTVEITLSCESSSVKE